jgi:hypothetical protein
MVSCKPRELRAGLVAEVFYAPEGWVYREITKITKVEKKPGHRATTAQQIRAGQPMRGPSPTRYLVWYRNIPGHRTLMPAATVHVTAESYYRKAGA